MTKPVQYSYMFFGAFAQMFLCLIKNLNVEGVSCPVALHCANVLCFRSIVYYTLCFFIMILRDKGGAAAFFFPVMWVFSMSSPPASQNQIHIPSRNITPSAPAGAGGFLYQLVQDFFHQQYDTDALLFLVVLFIFPLISKDGISF